MKKILINLFLLLISIHSFGQLGNVTYGGTAGQVALSNGSSTPPTWALPFTLTTTGTSGAATYTSGTLNIPQYSGGGITNAAASNELMKSNGTNAVASGFFSSSTAALTLGSASNSDAIKTLSAVNSTSDAVLVVSSQGAMNLGAGGVSGVVLLNPNSVELNGGLTASRTNTSLVGGTPSYGSGAGVVYIKTALTNPSGNPTGGGLFYSNSANDLPYWKTPSGEVRQMAANKAFMAAASDEVTALTTGTAKVTFRMPYALTLTGVRASLTTAQSSGTVVTINVKENGTTIFSTNLTIDNTETTSTTAATPVVISDAAISDDSVITVDIVSVDGATAAAGLKVTLIGY